MALTSISSRIHSPDLHRTYAANTARVLHTTDAPATAQVLPVAVTLVSAAGGAYVFQGTDGVQNTITLGANSYLHLRIAVAVQEAGGAAAVSATYHWLPEP